MTIPSGQTGTSRHLGYTVAFAGPDSPAVVTMVVTDDHTNRHGNLHGGLIATVLDTAMGATVSHLRGAGGTVLFSTVTLTTNFLAPMPRGTITATARITGGGHKTVFAEGEARDEAGHLIATATGVFKRAG
ncbi:MAG: PaaI family thioesterase [Rhodobacter sp.]|nr:PaaI family thioesterase [Paracoccaceae bacterium]MCC0078349.1 PaaI family thioesterase [Rhodobacter sp.]